jgi:hypothetical protein
MAAAVGVSAPRAHAQPAPAPQPAQPLPPAHPAPQPAAPAPQPAQPAPPQGAAAAPQPPAAAPQPAPGPAVPADEATVWDEPPGTESEDVGLFVPRAILTIPRVALKIVFWPIRHGLRFTERHALIEHVEDILYNDERTAGIVPTFSFLSSQGPSIGAKAFHNDVGGYGEEASIEARFGGRYAQAYQVSFESDQLLGSRYWLQLVNRYEIQPKLLFAGLGDDSPELSDGLNLGPRDASVETRFRQRRMLLLGGLGYTVGEPGELVKFGGTAVLNNRKYGPGPDGEDDPSIEEVYDTSLLPGFDQDRGAKTVELGGTIIVDTRDQHGATGSGMYLELFGGGVPRFDEYTYGHFGGEITGYINLYRRTRVLVLRAAHEAVAFDDEADIPFSDYPRLGGPSRLRGYALDRFRDTLTAVTTIEYHYPIHEYIAGSLFIDAGRPAEDYRGLFELDKWRLGGGGGFIFRSKNSVLFTVDVAYGDSLNVYLTTDPLRAFDGRNEQL